MHAKRELENGTDGSLNWLQFSVHYNFNFAATVDLFFQAKFRLAQISIDVSET